MTPGQALVALSGVAVALVVTLLLRPWLPYTQFVLFHGAVALAAAVGGLRLAVPALALSLVLAEVLVIGEPGLPALTASLVLRVALLSAVALGIAVLVDRLQAARKLAQRTLSEMRRHADVAAAQAAALERQVAESAALAGELQDVNRRLAEQTEAAERTGARAARLQRLTTRLLDTVGEGPVVGSIAREARRTVRATVAAVALPAADGGVEVRGFDGADRDASALRPRWLALMDEVAATGTARWLDAEPGDEPALAVLPLAGEQGGGGVILFAFERSGGFAADERWFTALVAQECAEALERARLHGRGMRALVRAEFAERRLAFLAEASARLASSLDYREALAALARMTVPELADCCMVHLLEESGAIRLVDLVHADPVLEKECRALEDARPGALCAVDLHGLTASAGVALVESAGAGRATAADPTTAERLGRLGLESQLVVPIVLDGAACGAITLAGETTRAFSEADRTLAVELARRAAQAVQNARLYQAAAHASEAKSSFLAVISHELRTPLNAIIGYADLLLLGIPRDLPDQTRRQVERIRVASDGLLHLVEEVLSFSRIEAGKEVLRVSPVDLSGLLRDAVSMVAPLASEKELSLHLELPPDPIRLVSDEHKIRQVITNLLSNAVKFTEHGSISVRAAVTADGVVVQVRDTGIGIATRDLDRIFEPFWQAEPAATRRFGGTGLGLGVARKLVRLLEGRLDVASEVGSGSVFTLVLPIKVAAATRDA